MFLAKATGKNTNYGKNNQVVTIADNFLKACLKEEWIYPKVYYLGYQNRRDKQVIEVMINKFRKEVE